MPTFRDVRNVSTGAQRTMDEFIHLVTEAALEQAQGGTIDKAQLLVTLRNLETGIRANITEAITMAESV